LATHASRIWSCSPLRAACLPLALAYAGAVVLGRRKHESPAVTAACLAFFPAVQAAYARLAGVSPAALTLAMEPYLPILRAFALAERATNPARREWLIQRVEASL